jgi:hypothetical protein
MKPFQTSIFTFASDFSDEGVNAVLSNVRDRGGLEGVTVASVYHHGRDIFPHGHSRKVHFLEGGVAFFQPDLSRYKGLRLQPKTSLAEAEDVLAKVCGLASRHSLKVRAWTVFLHNFALGERHPECVCRNAFGDYYLTDLCPANPDVRAFVRALAGDVARYELDSVVAESLHYHLLEHGFHHERYFIELGGLGRYLLGMCFCEHCLAAAHANDVDGERVRQAVRTHLEALFEADGPIPPHDLDRDELGSMADGEMEGYLTTRSRTVTSLVAEARAACSQGVNFSFIEISGATKGYATGRPTGDAAPSMSWQFGVNLMELASAADRIEVAGYTVSPDRLRLDLEEYRRAVGERTSLALILRPMEPDCASADNLEEKLQIATEFGVEHVSFYHYGFMRLVSLDLVRDGLGRLSRARRTP